MAVLLKENYTDMFEESMVCRQTGYYVVLMGTDFVLPLGCTLCIDCVRVFD